MTLYCLLCDYFAWAFVCFDYDLSQGLWCTSFYRAYFKSYEHIPLWAKKTWKYKYEIGFNRKQSGIGWLPFKLATEWVSLAASWEHKQNIALKLFPNITTKSLQIKSRLRFGKFKDDSLLLFMFKGQNTPCISGEKIPKLRTAELLLGSLHAWHSLNTPPVTIKAERANMPHSELHPFPPYVFIELK